MTALLVQGSASPPAPDSVRAALREVFSAREYDWVERTNALMKFLAWVREQYLRLLDWLAGLENTSPTSYYLLLFAMLIVLVAILVHFGYVLWRAFRPVPLDAGGARAPVPQVRDAAWHLAQARRLSGEGRYGDALGHRFLALLLDLERRKALSFHASKTPAEYVAEVRLDGDGRGRFRMLVLDLYRHLFGGVPCTAEEWDFFDREATELGGRVAPA